MLNKTVSIIIVEDDATTRKYFEENINWTKYNYELAGMAEDGIAGLELIEEIEPDIVITDIQMPCMDGLTMLKELKARGHHPRIIILSAYDEFEYAKTAINLSADAYINKPIDENILFEVLDQAKDKLENERRISSQVNDSLPLLRQSFLSQLLLGYYNDTDVIRNRADYLEFSFGEGPYLCVAARLDPLNPEIKKRNAQGREILKTTLLNIIRNNLETICQVYSCDTGELSFALLLIPKNKNIKIEVLTKELENIIHLSRIRMNIPLTLGLSNFHTNTISITTGYHEALKALSCDHVLGTDRIISIQDINPDKTSQSWEMQNVVNELVKAIRVADNYLADKQLTWLQEQLIQIATIPMIQIRMDCGTIAFAILNEAVSWLNEGRPKAQEAFTNVYLEIQQLRTIEELINSLKRFAITLISLVEETRQAHHQTILHKAMAYIETNYSDTELSLERTASAANVSQSHLSFLFKTKMQSSFHKYVTKTRIERAMALLKENDFRTYEVAEMVGYSNAQYFSVSFKKYTGTSPLQFKNN